jgi:hypothetical protein
MKRPQMSEARTGKLVRSNIFEIAEAPKTPGEEMAFPEGWKPTRLARILEVLRCILAGPRSDRPTRKRIARLSAKRRDGTLDNSSL